MMISTDFFLAEMKSLTVSTFNISRVILGRRQLVLTFFLQTCYRLVTVFGHLYKRLKLQFKKHTAFLNKEPLPRNIGLARRSSRVVSISIVRSVK